MDYGHCEHSGSKNLETQRPSPWDGGVADSLKHTPLSRELVPNLIIDHGQAIRAYVGRSDGK